MKLVPKLTAALVAGTFVVLAASGYVTVRREVSVLEADRVRDHALFGRTLGAAVAAVWRIDGRAEALKVIAATDEHGGTVRMRWVEGSDGPTIHAESDALQALQPGDTVTRVVDRRRFTYSPVVVGADRQGFVELSEPLEAERRVTRAIITDTLATTATMVVVCGLISIALGLWMVGRPVRALCAKARRTGEGDFSRPLELAQHDELGTLAVALNAMCGQLVDAKERVEQETAARMATLVQLRHADRLTTVGVLASEIAHELGTPLNVVLVRAQAIAAGDCAPDEAVGYANAIADAANRMTKIIRKVLAFARRQPTERGLQDLRRIAAETCELLRPLAKKNHVRLDVAAESQGAFANVDSAGIQQALANLVVNAIHAMPEGGVVDISTAHEDRPADSEHPGHYAVLRVRDQGTGIPADHLAHIFEPFFTTKDVDQGTGLGLSVTHGIVHDHRGFIDVENAQPRGTIFAIHLPAKESA